MTPAQQWLTFGTIPVLALCLVSWIQRRTWRKPPRNQAEARRRAAWSQVFPYPQLGVRIGLDRFVYDNLTGECLGHAGGATAAVVPSVPVTRLKPSIGWATITFADGTTHRQPFAMRNMPEAKTQAAKFNGMGKAASQAAFRRTKPATHPATRP